MEIGCNIFSSHVFSFASWPASSLPGISICPANSPDIGMVIQTVWFAAIHGVISAVVLEDLCAAPDNSKLTSTLLSLRTRK